MEVFGKRIVFLVSQLPTMQRTFVLLLLLSSLPLVAQHDSTMPPPINIQELKSNDGSFTRVESPPRFPGGDEALVAYLNKNLHYPEAMHEAKVEGVVQVVFTITDVGAVTNVRVEQGIANGAALNEEALRVVRAMPNWEPARVRGVTIPMEYKLPVRFELGK